VPPETVHRVGLTLEPDAWEILNRLRGDLAPSDFIQLLLRMADSGAVGSMPEAALQLESQAK
jgi:hypothetical protein